ncbi:MAG: rhomboid family intramembrane serine protease [Candidatus Dormibacteraeota bacterium]|nr:rhomboid family intramembrane serine protease [Candidatus Dormibacteraeota bacterium]
MSDALPPAVAPPPDEPVPTGPSPVALFLAQMLVTRYHMRLVDKRDSRVAALSADYDLCTALWTGPRAALVGVYDPPADPIAAGADLAARLEAARRWGTQRLKDQGAASCDILLVATAPLSGSIVVQGDPSEPVHAGAAWVDASQGAAGGLMPIPSGLPGLGELRAAARAVQEGREAPTLAAVDLAERQTVQGGYVAPVRRAQITQPIATYSLIGFFVLVYLLELALKSKYQSPSAEAFYFGALGNAAGERDWWRFISYAAIHDPSSILHILFNCVLLFFIGRYVEQLYGRAVLLGAFVITAAAGALFWVGLSIVLPAVSPAGALTLGASGGIAGLVGLLLMLGRVQGKDVPAGVATQVRNYAIIVIALNVALGFFIGGVNNFVHLGGVIAGALLGLVLPPLHRIGGRDLAPWERYTLYGVMLLGAVAISIAAGNLVQSLAPGGQGLGS